MNKFEQVVVDLFDRFFTLADEGLLPDWIEVDRDSKKIVFDDGKYYQLKVKDIDIHLKQYFVEHNSFGYVALAVTDKELMGIIKELVEVGNKVADYISESLNSVEDLEEVNKFTHEVASEMFGEYLSKKYGHGGGTVSELVMSLDLDVICDQYGVNVNGYELERALNDIVIDYFDEESDFQLKSKDALIHILTTIMWAYERGGVRFY